MLIKYLNIMGCCENKMSEDPKEYISRFKRCIQDNNLYMLRQLYQLSKRLNPGFDINEISIKVDDSLTVCPLGYSLLLGHCQIYSFVLKELNGDFTSMESTFEASGTSGLSVICLNNYISLLPLYLPYFISSKTSNSKTPTILTKTLALDPVKTICSLITSSHTPIQLACEAGYISILSYFLSYNSSLSLIPHEIDIHYIEPSTGYNCALIGCKSNNFSVIKFLHLQCKADFHILNAFDENALNILAYGSKENRVNTLRCLKYLIEKVGIDPCYNHQETLFLLEEEQAVEYLENLLETKGVLARKKEIVEDGRMKFAIRTLCKDYDTGNRFTFTRMFPELLKSTFGSSSFVLNPNQCVKGTES